MKTTALLPLNNRTKKGMVIAINIADLYNKEGALMNALRSKKEGADYLKVSLLTFNKFIKEHHGIIENKKINIKSLIKIIEKESGKKRGVFYEK